MSTEDELELVQSELDTTKEELGDARYLLNLCEHYVLFGSGQGADSSDPSKQQKNIPEERRELMQELHHFLHE